MSTSIRSSEANEQVAIESNIRIYNTLTKTKETFEPLQAGKVGIYLCGPTVYAPSHIGHMVGPVIFDTIKRYLVHSGYDVTWVVNITDVDDKLIVASAKKGVTMPELAAEMIEDYLGNLAALGVDTIDEMPKATENIQEIITLIASLIEQEFAYEADGDVLFDVARDADYGKLSNRSADDQQGQGGEAAAKKRNLADFALWKAAKEGEPSWDSPWGKGRPGWHIECSAMSRQILGETFDIHGGGLDLVFPHHENEMAQSECAHGKPMVKYWVHNGLLRKEDAGKIGGRDGKMSNSDKMSRSAGAGGLANLIADVGGETLRFFLLRTHYRSTIVFGDTGLGEAATALESFHRFFERMERINGTSFYDMVPAASREDGNFEPGDNPLLQLVQERRQSFLDRMDDDFNTGGAIGDTFELLRALNKFADEQSLEDASKRREESLLGFAKGVATLKEMTSVLGLFRVAPEKDSGGGELAGQLMDLIISLRASARAKKDFEMADEIRDGLTALDITLEDRKEGTIWRQG